MHSLKTILNVLSFLSIALTALHVSGQAENCGTDRYAEIMKLRHPEIAEQEKSFNENAIAYAKGPQTRAAIYTIPVVFHVIHVNGPENIGRTQILDQMRILNQDFQLLNPGKSRIRATFAGLAVDCQIQFKLATIDPNGNCTDGINRVYSPLGTNVSQSNEVVKELVSWPSDKYLNVWVISSFETISAGTLLGYATFPWFFAGSHDGIVLRNDRVGTVGTGTASDSGRTLTHEVGHWLGLYHTFQDDCSIDGDKCGDTPPVNGSFTNSNCPANGNSCTNEVPDKLDMWENYMDYSRGSCQNMFTPNQKSRMHSVLGQTPRKTVVAGSNLIATGVTPSAVIPKPEFTMSSTVICAGQPVSFFDASCKGSPTTWSWSFPGAVVQSSTLKNPVVVYQSPGTFTASLIVQNSKGTSPSVSHTITVLNAVGVFPNYYETFENGDPFAGSVKNISPTGSQWVLVTGTGQNSNRSIKAPISNSSTSGLTYSITLPSMNLKSLQGKAPKFSMYCAYAPNPNVVGSEILRFFISTDCGASFKQIFERSSTGLAYNGATPVNGFVPINSNQWKLMSSPLSAYDTAQNAILRIDVISNAGNPVYIDNINISQWFSGLNTLKLGSSLLIFPNPAREQATARLEIETSLTMTMQLCDMTGKVLSTVFKGTLDKGRHDISVPKPGGSASGLYLLRIVSDQGVLSKPVSFTD